MATKQTGTPPTADQAPTQDSAIAAAVRAEIARRQLTRDQVARRAGLTGPQLNRRLAGQAKITAAELLRLAEAIGVPATALLNHAPALTTRGVAR